MRQLLTIFTALLLTPLAALHAADTPPVQRRNILLITAEDICPNLGCYGDPNAVTPNLDRFAVAGVPVPDDMQGSDFLGPKAGKPRRYVHAARDFHDSADFDTCRKVRDARFYSIRNFMPQIGWDAIQYSWQKAPYMLEEWRQHAQAGKLQSDTYLDKARVPGARHTGIWSYDDVAEAIPLARASLSDAPDANAKLKQTRQKYLP